MGGIAIGALVVFAWMNAQGDGGNFTTITQILRDGEGRIVQIEQHEGHGALQVEKWERMP